MSEIRIDQELGVLQQAFDQRLDGMGQQLARAARGLPDRLGIRPRRPSLWTQRLSPVVVLYPLLQAQALPGVALVDARTATLAHLFLLVHSFVDDRLLDGQLTLTRDEIVFAREAFAEAERILQDLSGDARAVGEEIRRAQRGYHAAQMTRFADVAGDWPGALSLIRGLVADRARLGRIATTVLLRQSRVPAVLVAELEASFDALAVGLQWEDDVHDWPGDLATDQDNLVLESLWRRGVARGQRDPAVVERALLDEGLYESAFELLQREIGAATKAQRQRGNLALVACLTEITERAESLARDLQGEIERSRSKR